MFRTLSFNACGLVAMFALAPAFGRPILYPHSTTVMLDYREDVMKEAQILYAPSARWSIGVGHLELEDTGPNHEHEVNFSRLNLLVKRWNLESAQANVFTWGGVGQAYVSEGNSHEFAWNAGAQLDYETRRVYSSLRTDLHRSTVFEHRIDTLQLGVAPYEHDFDTLATWFVVQGRQYTGGIHEGTEWALLLRLFKRGAWIEAGVTDDGKLQAMAMVNF